jgi:predicted nuclease of predicted toxin-antitoxin system
MSDRRLASRLQAQGHDPLLASDVGLWSVTDARILSWAIAQGLPVLTRDSEDFTDLHDLIMAAGGHHPGLLVIRFDNDPRHNLTDRGIASAIDKLESSGVVIFDPIHVLNHWR